MPQITSTELCGSGVYVNLGSPAALNDLGAQTMLAYYRPTAAGGSDLGYLVGKCSNSSTNGQRFIANHNSGSPAIFFGSDSSGVSIRPSRAGPNNSITYTSWQHNAVTWDGALDLAGIKLYTGIGADLAEVSSYVDTAGSGSINSDAASNCYLFNRAGLGRHVVGDVAYIAIWDRVLSLSELQNAQNNGPLAEPTGLVLLWANEQDYSANALAPVSRSTHVAGALPPNTNLGGSIDLAGAAAGSASASADLTTGIPLAGAAAGQALASGDISAMVVDESFERSSVNVSGSSVTGNGDSAIVSIKPRVQESESFSNVSQWNNVLARVDNVNGYRPTFKFTDYKSGDLGYRGYAWPAAKRPLFSFDLVNWIYFDTATASDATQDVTFRHNTAFTQSPVYIANGYIWTVSQAADWIAGLESAYPSLIHNAASNVSGFSSGTFSTQTDELGRTIAAQPLYAFKISDASLQPLDGSPKRVMALVSGVHAAEDVGNLVHKAAVEYLLGASAWAQNVRRHFDIWVYPIINAPARTGGGQRGSYTQGTGGADDPNRHFTDADGSGLEVVTIPRAAMVTDMPDVVQVVIDYHSTTSDSYIIYTGTTKNQAFRTAVNSYMAGVVGDAGDGPAGALVKWYRSTKNSDLSIIYEIGEPSPVSAAQIQIYGEASIKAVSDRLDAGDISSSLVGAATATASASAALAGGTAALEGAAQGQAGAVADLATGIQLAGASLSVAGASGSLTTAIPLQGASIAVSSAAGALTAQIRLDGAALGQAAAAAGFYDQAALAGAAAASAAGTATLTVDILLQGAGAASAAGPATLTTRIDLSAAALAQAAAQGYLVQDIPLFGVALATAGATGALASGPGALWMKTRAQRLTHFALETRRAN